MAWQLLITGICIFIFFLVITWLCRCLRASEGHSHTTVVAPPWTQYPQNSDTTAYRMTAQPVIYSISNSNWQHPSSQTSYPVQGYGSSTQIGFVYQNPPPYNSRFDEPPPSYHEVASNTSKENIPLGPLASGQSVPRNANPS